MIATSFLLNGGPTLRTLLGIGRDPVGGLAVVVTLLNPLLDEVAPDGVMPVLRAGEAEHVTAPTLNRLGLHMLKDKLLNRGKSVFREGAVPGL